MSNNFSRLKEIGFFEHFETKNSDNTPESFVVQLKYKEKGYGISAINNGHYGIVDQFFGPGYGLFLITTLLYEGQKRGWERILLGALSQDEKIITQEKLIEFYRFIGFTWLRNGNDDARSMLFSYSGTLIEDLIAKVISTLNANADIKKSTLMNISPTSRGRSSTPFGYILTPNATF